MTVLCSARRWLMCLVVGVSLTGVASAGADKGVQVTAASAPAGTDVRVKHALSAAIRKHVAEAAGLAPKLRGYSILPALIQLRRVNQPGQTHPTTVCVVELSLQHAQKGLVANVRGNVSSLGATTLDTVDAAAHAAVDQLPETLLALHDQEQRRIAAASR